MAKGKGTGKRRRKDLERIARLIFNGMASRYHIRVNYLPTYLKEKDDAIDAIYAQLLKAAALERKRERGYKSAESNRDQKK